MPVKWTPTNVQMLLWLAWGNCKYEAQDIVDSWPTILGEEAPTKRAIQKKIGWIRKGVRDFGVAPFFGNGTSILQSKASRPPKGPGRERTRLTTADEADCTSTPTAIGLQHAADSNCATAMKAEGLSTAVKPETLDDTVTVATPYLSTPPRKPGPRCSSVAARSKTRKRRHSDASDSASMTTEETPSEISITAPEFEMKLRPDHRDINVYESDGEEFDRGSFGGDAAWVPGAEDGRGGRKRVRRR